jgi:CRP-like cAMP-binding protein
MVLLSGEAEVRGMFGHGVSMLKPGALIGEIAWLDHNPRTADVVASSEVQVAVFPADLLEKLDLEAPDVMAQLLYNVSKVLCSKLRWAQRLIDADAATNPWPDR